MPLLLVTAQCTHHDLEYGSVGNETSANDLCVAFHLRRGLYLLCIVPAQCCGELKDWRFLLQPTAGPRVTKHFATSAYGFVLSAANWQ